MHAIGMCCRRDAILASNTSTISLDLVSAKTHAAGGRQGRVGQFEALGDSEEQGRGARMAQLQPCAINPACL